MRVRVLTTGAEDAHERANGVLVERVGLTARVAATAPLPRRLRSLVRFMGETYAGVVAHMWSARADYDVVHCFGGTRFSIAALATAVALGKSTIVELTLAGRDDAETFARRSSLGLIGRMLKASLLRRVDRFVCNSRALADSCRAMGIPDHQVWFRLNPIDGALFSAATDADQHSERAVLGLPQGVRLMVTVGVISRRKNQGFFVEALAQAPKDTAVLVIVGPTEEADDRLYLHELRARVDALGLGQRVRIVAEHRDDVSSFLRAADLFVFASHAEGCPNAPQEALSTGLPVLGVDLCGVLTDIVHEGDGTILPASATPSAFAGLLSADVGSSHGERSQRAQRAIDRFSMDKTVDAYVAMYRDVTDARH